MQHPKGHRGKGLKFYTNMHSKYKDENRAKRKIVISHSGSSTSKTHFVYFHTFRRQQVLLKESYLLIIQRNLS